MVSFRSREPRSWVTCSAAAASSSCRTCLVRLRTCSTRSRRRGPCWRVSASPNWCPRRRMSSRRAWSRSVSVTVRGYYLPPGGRASDSDVAPLEAEQPDHHEDRGHCKAQGDVGRGGSAPEDLRRVVPVERGEALHPRQAL